MLGNLLDTVFCEILLTIDTYLYKFFAFLYGIYIELASLRLLDDSTYTEISSRIYLVVGVVALFMVAYSLLQHIINPDDKNNGSGITLVKKIVTAFLMVILVPTMFSFMYNLQTSILTGNVISNMILGDINSSVDVNYAYDTSEIPEDAELEIEEQLTSQSFSSIEVQIESQKRIGNALALTIFQGFFYPSDGVNPDYVTPDWDGFVKTGFIEGFVNGVGFAIGGCVLTVASVALITFVFPAAAAAGSAGIAAICKTSVIYSVIGISAVYGAAQGLYEYVVLTEENYTWTNVSNNTIFDGEFENFIPFSANIGTDLDYMFIISTIAVAFLVYVMFNFILDMGIRVIKLALYQIIAPIPIFLSILPKNEDLLKNWLKTVFTVYLEVFIRILCLCSIVYVMKILNNMETLTSSSNFMLKSIILISAIALLRQFPQLFSDITGIKSDMKLGIMEKLSAGGVLTAVSAIGGSITAGVNNFNANRENGFLKAAGKGVLSSGSGFVRGIKSGWGAKNISDMKTAASSASKAALKAAGDRSSNAERYKSSGYKSYAEGMVRDKIELFNDWAGINNVDSLNERKKMLEEVASQKGKFDAALEGEDNVIVAKNNQLNFQKEGMLQIQKEADELAERDFNDYLSDASNNRRPLESDAEYNDRVDKKKKEFSNKRRAQADKVAELENKKYANLIELQKFIAMSDPNVHPKITTINDEYMKVISNNLADPAVAKLSRNLLEGQSIVDANGQNLHTRVLDAIASGDAEIINALTSEMKYNDESGPTLSTIIGDNKYINAEIGRVGSAVAKISKEGSQSNTN